MDWPLSLELSICASGKRCFSICLTTIEDMLGMIKSEWELQFIRAAQLESCLKLCRQLMQQLRTIEIVLFVNALAFT